MATLAHRFEELVDRNGAHHLWLGAADRAGIPQMRVDGRLTTARRVAWELHHGALAEGARVRGCQVDSRCLRVEHLSLILRRNPRARTELVRRPRGQGSLREIRPGVWTLTITSGSGDRAFHTVAGDRIEAERELARLAAQHGQTPSTLDALVSLHHAHLREIGRNPSTLRRYEQLWRTWLAPSLGTNHPDDTRRTDIERALQSMHDAGQSPRSIHQAAILLNTTFTWARETNRARASPVIGCELPDGATVTATRHR